MNSLPDGGAVGAIEEDRRLVLHVPEVDGDHGAAAQTSVGPVVTRQQLREERRISY